MPATMWPNRRGMYVYSIRNQYDESHRITGSFSLTPADRSTNTRRGGFRDCESAAWVSTNSDKAYERRTLYVNQDVAKYKISIVVLDGWLSVVNIRHTWKHCAPVSSQREPLHLSKPVLQPLGATPPLAHPSNLSVRKTNSQSSMY